MSFNVNRLVVIALAWAALFLRPVSTIGDELPDVDVRVMSFNLRYGTANDGDNHWKHRKQLLSETIAKYSPDLLGVQETMAFQAKFLLKQFPDFRYVGKSREPDADDGEQCGIFYRQSRFVDIEQGHFWLSEQPDVPGSKSWDSSLPRMATWLKLYDKKAACSIYIFNSHFDHKGKQARAKSAELIHRRISRLSKNAFVVVTGDFNCGESSQPYLNLLSNSGCKLYDTFRRAVPDRGNNEGTFNGFRGFDSGRRIDWVLASSNLQTIEAGIDRTNDQERYPSDHYPVTATLRFVRPK